MGALCAPQETKTQLISFSYIYAHTSFLLLTRKNNNKKTWKTSRAMKTVQAEISSLLRNHFQLWHPLGIFLQVTFSSRTTVKRKTVLWTQSLKIVTFWHFCANAPCRKLSQSICVFRCCGLLCCLPGLCSWRSASVFEVGGCGGMWGRYMHMQVHEYTQIFRQIVRIFTTWQKLTCCFLHSISVFVSVEPNKAHQAGWHDLEGGKSNQLKKKLTLN